MNNFYERFLATVERFGARPAVFVQRRDGLDTFTYAELHGMAEHTAGVLAARGLAAGEPCAILADNDAHWCAAYLGIMRLGAVAVPLDTAYRAKQVATLLRDSGAKLIFTTPRYIAIVREAIQQSGAACEILPLHEIVRAGKLAALPPCPAKPENPAALLYTSGTTSDPKGVVITHANLLAEADGVFQVVHVDERDSLLGVLPLFHALAQLANLLLPFVVGASVVFLEAVNTSELLRALRERQCTIFVCVPQFFYLIHQRVMKEVAAAGWLRRVAFHVLLRVNGALRRLFGVNLGPVFFGRIHDVLGRRMRLLVTGGSRFDAAIGRDLYRLGFNVLQAYGLTECTAAATLTRPGDTRFASVGQAIPTVELKILPQEDLARPEPGKALRRTVQGEVLMRGRIVMQGYYNRPDVNAIALRDGWLHTGDLGYLDRSAHLYITGRKKEVIVLSSGKNIYPEEIEAHYLQSPYIKELCVMGLARPGEPAAERLHAVVVPNFDVMRERKVLNAREILRYEIESLSVELPSHKRILSYELSTEELPRTTTRKLKRFEIERRVRAAAPAAEEVPRVEAPAPSEEDLLWAADAHVARALEAIGEALHRTVQGEVGDQIAGDDRGARAALRPDANIELDLGLDSMERVELLTHLQHLFGTQVPEEVAHRIYTLRELVEAVRPAEGSAAPTTARGDAWGRLLSVPLEDDAVLRELLKPKQLVAGVMYLALKSFYFFSWLLLRFRVTGREHLPPRGPFLLCPNHQSFLDAFLLLSALPFGVLRQVFFVGASEYFATPLMRWVAKMLNIVPVDPDTNLLRAMQAGAFGLRHAKVLILFPEGERSIDGEVKKFKKGAPILATHLRAPIVPVALEGIYAVWPRGRPPRWRALLPWDKAHMRMRFGPPLAPPAALPADASLSQAEAHYSSAAEQLRSAVLDMCHALRLPW